MECAANSCSYSFAFPLLGGRVLSHDHRYDLPVSQIALRVARSMIYYGQFHWLIADHSPFVVYRQKQPSPACWPASVLTWAGPARTAISHHHGGVILSSKILVAYASRAGSTAEVAKTVGQVLSNLGARVDVLAVADVTDLSAYRAVVLGSAVRFGQWLPEALKFLEQHSAALRAVPVAFFSLHTLNLGSDEASRAARIAYTAPACKIVSPRVEAFFAGNGDPSRLPFFLRLLVKLTKSPEADLRDWTTIRGWAESLSGVL